MNLLVLGGSVFLGRHVVDAACADGHAVTVFNRGRTATPERGDVDRLIGDRDGDVSMLEGRAFDAVIDCSGYTPVQLERTAAALGDLVSHYLFVSSISVYRACPSGIVFDESTARLDGDEGYGPQKARSEDAITSAMRGSVTIVRPGLIVGPHDPTGRFTYWPRRMHEGGEVVAPGRADRPAQIIDVRDLAAWCVRLVADAPGRVLHGVGPCSTMGAMLEGVARGVDADARLRWFDDATLEAAGVAPWTGLPLWLPEHDAEAGGLMMADDTQARAAGLVCRSIEDTSRATLEWVMSPDASEPRAVTTLARARERELLG